MLSKKRRIYRFQGCGRQLSVLALLVFLLSWTGAEGRRRPKAHPQPDATDASLLEERVEAQMEIVGDSGADRRAVVYNGSPPPQTSGPSVAPFVSFLPSISRYPSREPTLTKELGASASPLPPQNPVPSTKPTVYTELSIEPYETATPSLSPSSIPSLTPTFASSMPTVIPSFYPSEIPSAQPYETATPSSSPSSIPSFTPTFASSMPTLIPSFSPSEIPSAQPSSFPSDQPSEMCHDMASYRSPINNLTCSDHVNTDCTRWRYIGLNISDLEDLVESCPISCDVSCGSFKILETNVSFVISNISGLLDFTTTPPFEEAVAQYLTSYVLMNSPVAMFSVTRAELVAQHIIVRRQATGSRLRRSLQQPSIAESQTMQLDIVLRIEGFWIDRPQLEISAKVLTDLLLTGVDSDGFTQEVRTSHSFFAHTKASSAAQAKPRPPEPVPQETEKVSSAMVAVSVLAALTICASCGGAILYHRSFTRRRPSVSTKDVPQALESPHSDAAPASVYSFENISPVGSSAGLGLLLSVFSSRSSGSTSPDSSQEHLHGTNEEAPAVTKEAESHESNQEAPVDTDEVHPFSGIIPPMIVIDNIDDASCCPTENTNGVARSPNKAIVPTKRLGASPAFIKALNSSHKSQAGAPSALEDAMLDMSLYGDGMFSPSNAALPVIFSDDNRVDDSSVSSTPVKYTQLDVDVPLRRTVSSGEVGEEVDVKEPIGEFTRTHWEGDEFGMPHEEEGCSDDGIHSQEGPLKISMSSEWPAQKPPRWVRHRRLSSSPEKHRRGSSWPEKYLVEQKDVSRRKSLSKVQSDERKSADKRPSRNRSKTRFKRSASLPKKLASSNGKSSHRRIHSLASSRGSTSSCEILSSDGECLYSYEASHRGCLGLSIEATSRGTIIHAVKEYSPLLGLVEVGDKVVGIDGVNTTSMSTMAVANLLGRKKGRSSNMRITVSRGTIRPSGIRTIAIPNRSQSRSNGLIHGSPSQESFGFTPLTDLNLTFVDLNTPDIETDERDDNPSYFHFIGARANGEEDFDD